MKEATGELNMTVITVVAIAAVGLLFYNFIWPLIKARIVQQTCDSMGANYTALAAKDGSCSGAGEGESSDCFAAESDSAGGAEWCCCSSAE